ncbi:MAG: oligosaccharide flippase family protein [Armatimonadetes bacterium]|nr:oligosaccharide flippase family protein [Armatimonadota bacterium]
MEVIKSSQISGEAQSDCQTHPDREAGAGSTTGKKRVVVENVASLVVLQGANYLLPVIVLPYLVRVLGAEKFGLLAFAQALTQYFVVLTDYGFNFTATRQIAVSQNNPQRLSEIFCSVLAIKLVLMLFGFLSMAALVFAVPKFYANWPIYFVTYLAVLGYVLFPVWFFQGMERMKYITGVNVAARAIATVAIFVLVRSQADFLLAAGLQAGGFVLAGLLGLWFVWRDFSISLILPSRFQDVISTMREGSQVFIATLSGNVYGQGAVLVTGLLAGHTAAGYYMLAQKIGGAAVALVQPVAQGIYPHMVHLFTQDFSGYHRSRKRVLAGGLAIGLAVGSVLFLFSHPIASAVAGRPPVVLPDLLKVFSFIIVLIVMNVLLNPFILAMKKYDDMQRMYMMAAILFVLVSIPATGQFGPMGMACTVLGIEAFVFIRSIQIAKVLE